MKKKSLKVKTIKRIKTCPICQIEIGRKTRTCVCGHKFLFQKKGKWEEIKDWKRLKRGDIFYLKHGSKGPYYKGEKGIILMGYRGKFVVRSLDTKGIIAYNSNEGMAYIYMGPNMLSESTNICRRKYRLFKKI